MPRRALASLSVALLILLVPTDGEGQARALIYSERAEKIFADGLADYRAERYNQALDRLQRLLEFRLNQRSSAGQLLQCKALFRLGRFAESLDAARSLQRKFAESRYRPAARLVAGDAFFKLKRYYEAATEYGRLLATATPLDIQAQAAERLAAIAQNGFINDQGLENLSLELGAGRLREALFFGRARWFQRLGWLPESAQAMQAYRDAFGGGIFTGPAVLTGAEVPVVAAEVAPPADPVGHADRPRLGLLLPMTGPYRPIGAELYEGVQLANEDAGEIFELIVADTGVDYEGLPIGDHLGGDVSESPGSGLLRVVHGARRLAAEGAVAIIGPVFSSSAVAAAVVAESAGLPLLVPLSQQSGLDLLGHHVFQLSSIPEAQARILAEYATLVLGLQHLVVISPLSDYGWSFEREFNRVANANGGIIAHRDWYIPNQTKDFRRVFEEIRSAGFALMPPPVDTLAIEHQLQWSDPNLALDDEEPSFLTELLRGLEEKEAAAEGPEEAEEEAPPDSSEIFIDTIDGVVVAVESFADVQAIVPQVSFHRLDTQILGNDIWYDPEAIRQMRVRERDYLDGAIFVSARQEEATVARNFVDVYRKRFQRDPNYAATAYDATRMLGEGWAQGNCDRLALSEWLAGIGYYEGASGIISLSSEDNRQGDMILLKVDGGKIRAVDEEDLPAMRPLEDDLTIYELDLTESELPRDQVD